MINEHDNNIKNGKPHPMTDDQIKQQQKGKEKQQAQQAKAKETKDKENNANKTKPPDEG